MRRAGDGPREILATVNCGLSKDNCVINDNIASKCLGSSLLHDSRPRPAVQCTFGRTHLLIHYKILKVENISDKECSFLERFRFL